MRRRSKSIKGLFGQAIHCEDGIKVGESWPDLFDGPLNHYDTDGRYFGYSDRGYIGETWEGFAGGTTGLDEASDSFGLGEW